MGRVSFCGVWMAERTHSWTERSERLPEYAGVVLLGMVAAVAPPTTAGCGAAYCHLFVVVVYW